MMVIMAETVSKYYNKNIVVFNLVNIYFIFINAFYFYIFHII